MAQPVRSHAAVLQHVRRGDLANWRAQHAPRKFTIIGNAGIGKSAFGAYLLWRAVQARRTVVYVSDKAKNAFVLHGDGRGESFPAGHYIDRADALLDEKSTVLICDGVKPPVVDAFTLLITSPVRERWKEFDKLPDELRFFFPVFSRGEMGDMLRACFPRLLADATSGGEAGVWARYGKWGGIPRYVFSKLDPVSQAQLTYALNSSTLVEELVKHLGVVEIASDSAVSHRLVHLKLRGETDVDVVNPRDASWYEISRSELGSRFIAEGVFRAVQSQRSERINSLLAAGPDSLNASVAALYGSLFAQGALEALAAGGTFQLFDLTGGADAGKLVLPHCSTVFFGDVRALEEAAAARRGTAEMDASIFLPTSATFTAVDAVLGRGRALVNFTINLQHDLKLCNAAGTEGAIPVARALGVGEGDEIAFYWALPRRRFEAACKACKPFRVTAPPGAAGALAGRRIRQYALLVPFELRDGSEAATLKTGAL